MRSLTTEVLKHGRITTTLARPCTALALERCHASSTSEPLTVAVPLPADR